MWKRTAVVGLLSFAFLPLRLGAEPAAQTAEEALPEVKSYEQLVAAIRKVRKESRLRIEQAVDREKVREAWLTGKLIEVHVLHHEERAKYGERVLKLLAVDLGTSDRELYYNWKFARAYPISPPAAKLNWSHFRELLSIEDVQEREELTKQADREDWGRDRLREEVRKKQESRKSEAEKDAGKGVAEEVLTATPGKPGTYQVVKAHDGRNPDRLVLDLGFSNYYRPPGEFPFKEGDIITVVGAGLRARPSEGAHTGAPLQKISHATFADLFTYHASVIHVIDGDTFTAAVDLGFGFTTVQTLRLRGLDAPEIFPHETSKSRREALGAQETSVKSAGREAKEFLEKTLPVGSRILVRTSRSDKYDRYLADVWANPARDVKIPAASTRPTGDEWGEKYVNQELVEKGFAVPVAE